MTELNGRSFIGAKRGSQGERSFRAVDPATGDALEPDYVVASEAEVEEACREAAAAAPILADSAGTLRAGLLRAIADGLETAGAEIVARAGRETALPPARLEGELGRTCAQLQLFATVAEEGSWVEARIDRADPERRPTPRPDVRSMRRGLGPVAVFGASNFPLAFSVAGGDTASALAAGNPVVVKAHPAHPGTCELVGAVIAAAVAAAGLPGGVFSLLFDDRHEVGRRLVLDPAVAAVGFTGSRTGGEALMRLAAGRPRPIPVYAEMGSVNPVIVLPGALAVRGAEIAAGLHASLTLGVGQFCTNPGVVLLTDGAPGDAFVERLAELVRATPAGTMLTGAICESFGAGTARFAELGAETVAVGAAPENSAAPAQAALWQAPAARVLSAPELLDEVFGPATLVVRYGDVAELLQVLHALRGQLTVSVHSAPGELHDLEGLGAALVEVAGRVVFDQFPTGVEVNHAMVHGGPFPATSDGRSTSVGSRAIERFSRLVSYQNAPPQLLPPALADANPLGLLRMVDGTWTRNPID